jgi:hypothetical protein
MKNIHIIKTDKSSILGKFIDTDNLVLRNINDIPRGENVHIYITSDEEIKEGDWYLGFETNYSTEPKERWVLYNCVSKPNGDYSEKIILTTDQSLNSVQAIDDDFLKWICKNPSCEEVGVELIDTFKKTNEVYVDEITGGNYYEIIKKYKIIIPKEEIKQEKLYTEKEVIEIVKKSRETGLTAEYLIEQFKKK